MNRNSSKLFQQKDKKKINASLQDEDYDKTFFKFGSPIHDTQSAIQEMIFPDGSHGSANANHFKYSNRGTPTSPIKFDSPQKTTNDNDLVIFQPDCSTSFDKEPQNSEEVPTPSLKENYSRYQQFVALRKPPPIQFSKFLGYLHFQKPIPESLTISKITTINFLHSFKELKEYINKEIHLMQDEISHLESDFEKKPPNILESFDELSEYERRDLIHYFQLYTDKFRSSSTLWINNQILNLEKSYSRTNYKMDTQKLRETRQSAFSTKDYRLDKYSKYIQLQEKLQNSKISQNQFNLRNKYLSLKSSLSFTVTQIKKGKGTIKLADYLINEPPFTPENRYEGHCIIASSYRAKEFQYEVNEIGKLFPFVRMIDKVNLYVTVARNCNPELRFDVIFPIQHTYPWYVINAKVKVLIGNSNEIESKINEICSNVSFVRRPILEICKKIEQNYLNS